jgi:hypothetical protein
MCRDSPCGTDHFKIMRTESIAMVASNYSIFYMQPEFHGGAKRLKVSIHYVREFFPPVLVG